MMLAPLPAGETLAAMLDLVLSGYGDKEVTPLLSRRLATVWRRRGYR